MFGLRIQLTTQTQNNKTIMWDLNLHKTLSEREVIQISHPWIHWTIMMLVLRIFHWLFDISLDVDVNESQPL